MLYMPGEMQGKHWKLTWSFHGPCRVLTVIPTNVEVWLVDDPSSSPIFVSLNQVRDCYMEQANNTWRGWNKEILRGAH